MYFNFLCFFVAGDSRELSAWWGVPMSIWKMYKTIDKNVSLNIIYRLILHFIQKQFDFVWKKKFKLGKKALKTIEFFSIFVSLLFISNLCFKLGGNSKSICVSYKRVSNKRIRAYQKFDKSEQLCIHVHTFIHLSFEKLICLYSIRFRYAWF